MAKNKDRSILSWVFTLYYCQGLPFSIVRQVSVVFFKDQGVGLGSLGLTSLYGMPWTFKFLWGPFVDRFSTKRTWTLTMELLLGAVLGFVSLSILNGATVWSIALLFLIIAIIAATHDIAIDGFYLEALPKDNQAKYSGLWQMGYRLALLTGSGVLVGISKVVPWWGIFGLAGLFFIFARVWHGFILPQAELNSEGLTKGSTSQPRIPIIESFQTFLQLPGIGLAIAFFILYKVGDALLFGMSTPFLLDIGVQKDQLGLISGGFGTCSAILATLFGGWFISKYSLRRGLYIFSFIQSLAIPVYAYIAWTRPSIYMIGAGVVIEQVSAGLGSSAYANFMMRQINPKYKASHYAIGSSMMSLTTMLSGAVSGFAAQKYGYLSFFLIAFGASIPGLILVPFVARRPECR